VPESRHLALGRKLKLTMARLDVIIVGGGLRGCLTALALRRLRPELDLCLIDSGSRLGGGPVEACFTDCLPLGGHALIADSEVRAWPGFVLIGEDGPREIARPISVVAPEQLHAEMLAMVGPEAIRLGAKVGEVGDGFAQLDDGELAAGLVLDFRPQPIAPGTLGQSLENISHIGDEPVLLDLPVLADASVLSEHDRRVFQYIPMDPRWLLVRKLGFEAWSGGPAITTDALGDPVHRRFVPLMGATCLAVHQSLLLPSRLPEAIAVALLVAGLRQPETAAFRAELARVQAAGASQARERDDIIAGLSQASGAALFAALALAAHRF
jgi:Lycopene cyclase protein